jgi:GH18 family chitinase
MLSSQRTSTNSSQSLTSSAFGGWDLDEDFRPKTIDDTSQKAFADEMVKFVDQYKLDGVDLDWEAS